MRVVPKSIGLSDPIDRSERHKTERRRENRARRRHLFLLASFACLAGFVVSLPSLISQTGYGRTLVTRYAVDYGFDVTAGSVRIGWITPLRMTDIRATGSAAGSRIEVDQVDTDITVLDVLASSTSHLGQIDVRGLRLSCELRQGGCGLEDDLQTFLAMPAADGPPTTAAIRLQDVRAVVVDRVTGQSWTLDQANADIDRTATSIETELAGVLRQPDGNEGGIQGTVSVAVASADGESTSAPDSKQPFWAADIQCESLPLSWVAIVQRRFPEQADSLPADVRGDVSGKIGSTGFADGVIDVSLRDVQIRNFVATKPKNRNVDSGEKVSPQADVGDRPADRLWRNELATLSGDLLLLKDRIVGRQLQLTSDFASLDFDGAFANSMTLAGETDNPLRWFSRIDGLAEAEIDLARLHAALPGLLPTREDAEITDGRVRAKLESLAPDRVARSRVMIQTDPIRAMANRREVTIAPVRFGVTVVDDRGELRAEQFQCQSSFANATGSGDLRGGQADVDVDFGKLADTLRPILDLSQTKLQGTVVGRIDWNVDRNNRWALRGEGQGNQLLVTLPDGTTLSRNTLNADIEAVGTWQDQALAELSTARIGLKSDGLNLSAELSQAVRGPGGKTPFPILVKGSGPIETLFSLIGPWMPEAIDDAGGSFKLHAEGRVASTSSQIRRLNLDLIRPRLVAGDRSFHQDLLKLDFDGDCRLPDLEMDIQDFKLQGDSLSAAAAGRWSVEDTDLEFHWRADLQQLQGSVRPRIARRDGIRQVSFRASHPGEADQLAEQQWLVSGKCEGRVKLTQTRGGSYLIDTNAIGKNIGVHQPPAVIRSYQAGPPLPVNNNADRSPDPRRRSGDARTVWHEPNMNLSGRLAYDPQTGRLEAEQAKLVSDWFATDLTGHAIWNDSAHDVRLRGPASLKMVQVAELLSELTDTKINAIGVHETPVQVRVGMAKTGNVAFDIFGDLGWEQADIAGVALGEARIPFRMTETSVSIDRSAVPVGGGQVFLHGQVHYRPGPLWMRLEPGRIAESVRVTPEMVDRWLKYLAPVVADAARIDGTFGCHIDQGTVVIDDPTKSQVLGRLDIAEVQMLSGPMTTPIIAGLDQLRGLAGLAGGQTPRDRSKTKLVSLPPQQVEFRLDQGVVTHQRLVMQIDRVQVFTGGQVHTDGRLNMVAQVPLDESWLGQDLRIMAGQTLRFPMTGTIWKPQLDSREMQRALAGLGGQAINAAAESYLDRGRQKINNELNRGFEKLNESLNLGPIFGR